MSSPVFKIAVVDDHPLFRKGTMGLVDSFAPECKVIMEAGNGRELLDQIENGLVPDLIISDLTMPVMDGFELAAEIKKKHPQIKILVLSMINREETVIKMLRYGVKGYLSKDIQADELRVAIRAIMDQGFYYTDYLTGRLLNEIKNADNNPAVEISEREHQFLKLVCSDDSYQQIADKMFLSIKTVDGYRASLFEKLKVKSRTGLALYAVKTGIVSLD
ncbi:MAG: response regulator transcription factor [Flavobacteriales bacterium]|nr:response regulator transcription factor [Flavobacteriales bacterium]